VKLSIVILCWNDQKVIVDCLRSIYSGTHSIEFEVIVSDNGSTDGSPDFIRAMFPQVRVIENNANLRFSKGNNVGIQASMGEYILILNPDTLIHEGSLDRWIEFADGHTEAGGFGCRVLNPDGSYQSSARPFPTIWRGWLGALRLRNTSNGRAIPNDSSTGILAAA
jgi:GT2 family glycosyltransferase